MEKNSHDDVNLGLLIVIGIVSTILLLEIVIVTQAYFSKTRDEAFVASQMSQPLRELNELVAAQESELNSYHWADREKQRVSVPIDVAITQFVQAEQQRATTRPK